jgi:hypothetical protein
MRAWRRTGGFAFVLSKVNGPIRSSPTWICGKDSYKSSMRFAAVPAASPWQVTIFRWRAKRYSGFEMLEHHVSWSCCMDSRVDPP